MKLSLIQKSILTIAVTIIGNHVCLCQVAPEVKNLVPWDYITESVSKNSGVIMGIESYVKVSISADILDTDACTSESISSNGLSMDYMWFNTNDETGKMMLKMHSDLNGIEQEKENFKLDDATEEEFMGGTLWVIASSKDCINEISGPTGKTEYNTRMRYFGFNGTTIAKIEVHCECKPDKVKQIIKNTLQLSNEFDFSVLKNTVKTY